MSSLLVFGGNGFLGRRICQTAVEKGFQVTSLSRSGSPPRTANRWDKEWIDKVHWEKCDVLDPKSYTQYLKDADNVVHSIGILLEDSSYKAQINGKLSFDPKNLLKWGPNPMKNNPNFTYEVMNKKTALMLAEEFSKVQRADSARERTMSYISADRGFPGLPSGYIKSKREAEAGIMRHEQQFRPILVRPGFMFDELDASLKTLDVRSQLKHVLEMLNWGNDWLLGRRIDFINQLIRPTVSTQQVSRALLQKIESPDFKGVLTLEEIIKS
ncbi:ubiquinone biosynthesis protein COQ11 [Lachancea thermotolerans CBS 6340]|uniref:KLTH0G14916p n=1 Tax=Lachancea thermotolerans (strain ATCC 56472 / CBS 6340 / NRRL Y-8284) TaxID=559295 RepID=C5DN83_LACTC|nr:KLTH0G14916p [Lachancea thermotolerans CBS 6340]CAR25244.1 KLTH0G14916p [Lachancea thermotolerans CBS 6340]